MISWSILGQFSWLSCTGLVVNDDGLVSGVQVKMSSSRGSNMCLKHISAKWYSRVGWTCCSICGLVHLGLWFVFDSKSAWSSAMAIFLCVEKLGFRFGGYFRKVPNKVKLLRAVFFNYELMVDNIQTVGPSPVVREGDREIRHLLVFCLSISPCVLLYTLLY